MTFQNPFFLILLCLLPILAIYYFTWKKRKRTSLRFSSVSIFKSVPPSLFLRLRHLTFFLRLLVVLALILSLARPRTGKKNSVVKAEGIDILLCIDSSFSMKGEDMKPNRLETAKAVMNDFASKRSTDRIGLVVYAAQSFLQCPLTLDQSVLIDFIRRIDFDERIGGGTAIGVALATSVSALRTSSAKSKVIILLTDGANNTGEVDPITAAELAHTFDVKVYTIGIGKPGLSKVPITQDDRIFGKRVVFMQNEMNEGVLKEIASITGGRYFNAQNKESLTKIYQRIDRYEKTEILSTQYLEYEERYLPFAAAALIFLLLETTLLHTRFRKIP